MTCPISCHCIRRVQGPSHIHLLQHLYQSNADSSRSFRNYTCRATTPLSGLLSRYFLSRLLIKKLFRANIFCYYLQGIIRATYTVVCNFGFMVKNLTYQEPNACNSDNEASLMYAVLSVLSLKKVMHVQNHIQGVCLHGKQYTSHTELSKKNRHSFGGIRVRNRHCTKSITCFLR